MAKFALPCPIIRSEYYGERLHAHRPAANVSRAMRPVVTATISSDLPRLHRHLALHATLHARIAQSHLMDAQVAYMDMCSMALAHQLAFLAQRTATHARTPASAVAFLATAAGI